MKHKSYHLFPSCFKGQRHHTYIKYSCQRFYSHLLAPACLIHTWLPPISLFQKQFFLFWSFQIKVSSIHSENSFILGLPGWCGTFFLLSATELSNCFILQVNHHPTFLWGLIIWNKEFHKTLNCFSHYNVKWNHKVNYPFRRLTQITELEWTLF